MRTRERFSLVDAAWLHMDEPTNMALIVGVMMFDEPLDFGTLKELVRERMLRVPRFRQRVREPLLGVGVPEWETDPHFDLDAHLHRIALPAPHDQAALHDLVSDLMGMPLDFSKPLWQMHFIENYENGCAIVTRLHHAMADGMALVQVMLSMADSAAAPPASASTALVAHPNGRRARRGLVGRTFQLAQTSARFATGLATDRAKLRDTALLGAGGAFALGKLLLIGPDQDSSFKGPCGVTKRAAWTKPLLLEDVKYVAHTLGATLNDVLISAVAGALRRYLEARDVDTDDMNLRAIVPVNLRSPGELDLDHMGNRFGLVFLALPVGIAEPLARMAVLKQRMDDIKRSPEAIVAFGILGAIGATPVLIERVVNTIFGMKATAVMTNVPGPREPLYLAGKRIRGIMFWVPTPAKLGLGVSIISYAGEVIVGVGTDAGLVPDPEEIVSAFDEEFQVLMQLAEAQAPRKPRVHRAARGKRAAAPRRRTKSEPLPLDNS